MTLHNLLRCARLKAGLSKRKLALKAGLCPSYITHIEAGRKLPSLSALASIASVLGVPVSSLVADGDQKEVS